MKESKITRNRVAGKGREGKQYIYDQETEKRFFLAFASKNQKIQRGSRLKSHKAEKPRKNLFALRMMSREEINT
jgi:hypothetical protein